MNDTSEDITDVVEKQEKPRDIFGEIIEETYDDASPIEARPFYGEDLNYAPTSNNSFMLKREKPCHRAICIMAARGLRNDEIVEESGYSSRMVQYVTNQPWAKKWIAELQERAGRKIVLNELNGAAHKAALRLIKEMDNEKTAKAADRIKAANDILNRHLGVALQTVRHERVDPNELSDEQLAEIATSKSN